MEFEVDNAKFIQFSKFNLRTALNGKDGTSNSRNAFVSKFVDVVKKCKEHDYEAAFELQLKYTQDLIESFDYTHIRFLYIHLNNLLLLAAGCDQLAKNNKRMESTTRTLMKAFNYALNDRNSLECSRKWAAFAVLLLLFKSFIRLKTLNLIRNSLRALSNAQQLAFPRIEDHPKHISVGIKFYTGFYNFSNENYQDGLIVDLYVLIVAFTDFMYAFEFCHHEHVKNKLSALKYLIPCALINGKLPRDKLLSKYSKVPKSPKLKHLVTLMESYRELVSAIRTGNYRRFHRNMEKNEHFYLSMGVYLILERVRTICLARLFKKVYLLQDKQTRLHMSTIHMALKFCNFSFTLETDEDQLDECECLVANLIHQGLVKGYISHEKRTIVLSNMNPFPQICKTNSK